MKEPLQHRLSEIGESFDYLRSDVRNLSRYTAKLENLLECYRSFVSKATLTQPSDLAEKRKLLSRTEKIIGPPPDKLPELANTDDQETEKAAPGNEALVGPLVQHGTCEH
jgi:hypothetical protein